MVKFSLVWACVVALLFLGMGSAPATAAELPPKNVEARLWLATANGAVADCLLQVSGYPDLSPARALIHKDQKTKFVAETLLAFAQRAQANLRQQLDTDKAEYAVLWVSNQIVLKNATRAALQKYAAHKDVVALTLDVKTQGVESAPIPHSSLPIPHSPFSIPDSQFPILHSQFPILNSKFSIPHSPTWGVQQVRAPQVWAQGYTGQGITVADLDTGVRWEHAALKPKYRGWDGVTATHNYNWFDPVAFLPAPLDDNGHGTHTTGSIVGDDGAGSQIGVAPGARWIGCRNMNGGTGSVALYSACFQFALAPTDVNGNNPDPGKAADITNNSWGCFPPNIEVGCEVPTALITVTQALRDAGILIVASAGNNGSACNSVQSAPATLDQSFTVGATNSGNTIANFSSRGPSTLTNNRKPDLVAPGVAVRSSYYLSNNSYTDLQGTSMASPHVAGVAALLWSAVPLLRGDVARTEQILRQTATPITATQLCGADTAGAVPNNVYGYGLVNAEAALAYAKSLFKVYYLPVLSR